MRPSEIPLPRHLKRGSTEREILKTTVSLDELKKWCLGPEAKPGVEMLFSVGEEFKKEDAPKLAFEVNRKREGHVWITVLWTAYPTRSNPKCVTRVLVRCTD